MLRRVSTQTVSRVVTQQRAFITSPLSAASQTKGYTKTNSDYVESAGCEELSRRQSLLAEMASMHKTAEIVDAANHDLMKMREQMPAQMRQDLGARHEAATFVFRLNCGGVQSSHGGSPAWGSMSSTWASR